MMEPTISAIRAYTVKSGGGADYHDQGDGHWIDGQISTPMSKYDEYKYTRKSFGINVLGTLVIEVEASDGTIGFAVTTAGEIGAYIVEKHLYRFVEGKKVSDIALIWDQMYNATMFYGRKGVVLNTISGVDLALWDLLGKVRGLPVYQLLGGAVRDELSFYATGIRPDLAKKMGFIGGKMPLKYGPADGEVGLKKNIEMLAEMRQLTGDDFWLMFDCWMSLDLNYSVKLAHKAHEYGLKWIEEALPPDDYWGYQALKSQVPQGMLVTTGEHEATLMGFRLLLEKSCCDIIQPDVNWCGGMTELIKISALAQAHGALVIPHGSSVYSYHFVITCINSPFAEFLMMAPQADEVIPMFSPLLMNEPVPIDGKLSVEALNKPGFGVSLNPECELNRPYSH